MSRFCLAFPLFLLLLGYQLFDPGPVYALQAHSYIGLYVHQAAHLFFFLAMLSFTFRIHRFGLNRQPEWRWISKGAWLLAFWNIWAFSGHILELYIPADYVRLLDGELVPSLAISSWREVVYYLLKMDHLLCVPSVLCFFIGIKIMVKGARQQDHSRLGADIR